MQGLTVPSLNEQSAVNDSSTLVLKVRVPCISKLNNEKMIIKDSSAPLKLDTSGLSNMYTSCDVNESDPRSNVYYLGSSENKA